MSNNKYLEMLAQKYPNHRSVNAEIVNLRAILALPKGTEYFLSDLHGEYDAFQYFVRSASGTIKMKIDENFGAILSATDREQLAALIYDPINELKRREANEVDFNAWCSSAIYRLIIICRAVSNKYTRSKVRRILPDNTGYIMDELMFADDDDNRQKYYQEIIDSVSSEISLIEALNLIGLWTFSCLGGVWIFSGVITTLCGWGQRAGIDRALQISFA